MLTSTLVGWFVECWCCRGGSFEEGFRWELKLGVFADLVELDDEVDSVTLLNTVEALIGAFFFSTSVELNTKGAEGGGAGHEMMDSNMSLPSILTPEHFLVVSAICLDRPDLACTCFSGRVLVQNCGRATCITTYVTRDTIWSAAKLNVLIGDG